MGLLTWMKNGLGGPMSAEELRRDIRTGDVFAASAAIIQSMEHIMSALTDLQAAVAAAVAKIDDLQAKLATASAPVVVQGTSDADLAAATASLNAATAPVAAPAPAAPSAQKTRTSA